MSSQKSPALGTKTSTTFDTMAPQRRVIDSSTASSRPHKSKSETPPKHLTELSVTTLRSRHSKSAALIVERVDYPSRSSNEKTEKWIADSGQDAPTVAASDELNFDMDHQENAKSEKRENTLDRNEAKYRGRRRRRRRRLRRQSGAVSGAVAGGFAFGPAGVFLGGVIGAVVALGVTKVGEIRKDARVERQRDGSGLVPSHELAPHHVIV